MNDAAMKDIKGLAPPVIADPDAPDAEAALLSVIDSLAETPVDQAADAEGTRLGAYFSAMDRRLALGAQRKKPLAAYLLPSGFLPYKPIDRFKPGALKGIFNYVSKISRSANLSSVAVMPDNILPVDGMIELEKSRTVMRSVSLTPYPHSGAGYGLGFIQILKPRPGKPMESPSDAESSTTFPVMTLDSGMMRAVAPLHPEAYLKALQDIITAGNHDMLHHYTVTASKANITGPFDVPYRDEFRRFDLDWSIMHGTDDPLGYESALVVAHAKTWQELLKTPAGERLRQNIDTAFDELGRLSAGLAQDSSLSPEDRHKTIDYFSTAVAFSLMRIVPFNHPLMRHSLARMEAVDPLPQTVAGAHSPAPEKKSPLARTIANYRRAGDPLDDPAHPYRSAKQLQLAAMVPEIAILHSPGRKGSDEYEANARSDAKFRDIINIITPKNT